MQEKESTTAKKEVLEPGAVMLRSLAIAEVKSWLDFQGINEAKREVLSNSMNRIIDAVTIGLVVFKEDKSVVQKLRFPFGAEQFTITELKFKPSIKVGDVQTQMLGTRDDDSFASAMAHISAATGEPKAVIQEMNNKDYKLSDAIIVFFML